MNDQDSNKVINKLKEITDFSKAEFVTGNYKEALNFAEKSVMEMKKTSIVSSQPYLFRAISRIFYDFSQGKLSSIDLVKSRDDISFHILFEYINLLREKESTLFDFFWHSIGYLILAYDFDTLSELSHSEIQKEEVNTIITNILDNADISGSYKLSPKQKVEILSNEELCQELNEIVKKATIPAEILLEEEFIKHCTEDFISFFDEMFSHYEFYLLQNGNIHYDEGDKRNALFYYAVATNVNSESKKYVETVLAKRAICHLDLKEYDKAKFFFEKAIKVNPNNEITKEYLDICNKILR